MDVNVIGIMMLFGLMCMIVGIWLSSVFNLYLKNKKRTRPAANKSSIQEINYTKIITESSRLSKSLNRRSYK